MLLQNKIAIVTGGGRGIGKAISLTLGKEGAKVAVLEINPDTARATADEIERAGGAAVAIKTDVSKSSQVNAAVQQVLDKWGRLDVLVNNAALVPDTLNYPDLSKFNPLADTSDDTWAREIGVNLSGVFFCIRAAAKPMVAQKYGKIITISSIVAATGGLYVTASYSASKSGVIGVTKLAARWLGKYGVNVNAIMPGPTPTEGAVYGPAQLEGYSRTIPYRRRGKADDFMCQPQDVANSVLFLASDLSEFITGHAINLSGGHWM